MSVARTIRLLGTGVDLTIPLGSGPPTPTAGSAQWEEVNVPERDALTNYTGDSLVRLDVPVLLNGLQTNTDVEPLLNSILALTRKANDADRPPSFTIQGPFIYSGLEAVMDFPDFGSDPESIRNANGVLLRQALVLKIIEFNDPDAIVFTEHAAGGASGAAAKKKKKKKTVTAKGGQTLLKIAQQQFGDPKKAKEIAKLNGIRDTRKKLKAGRVIKLPPGSITITSTTYSGVSTQPSS